VGEIAGNTTPITERRQKKRDVQMGDRSTMSTDMQLPGCLGDPSKDEFFAQEDGATFQPEKRPRSDRKVPAKHLSMTVAEFVDRRFIPEYVSRRRTATRLYFQSILKYIVTPACVARAFGNDPDRPAKNAQEPSSWPHLDAVLLKDVTPEAIQHLISASIQRGYSPRTATHIRNVLRSLFSFAASTGNFTGTNPASMVAAPTVVRKEPRVLSLDDLRQIMRLMRYPEKSIAIFALSADINVSEICGLQWKFVNISFANRQLEGESLPPKAMAVRNLSYRGVFEPVKPARRRLIPISDLLHNELAWLRRRERHVGLEDFVIASRTGTPINADNIAIRRLKLIGSETEMPWLSWKVFQRTRESLVQRFGRHLNRELERAIQPRAS
jgi:site-specific recombinase XerC